MHTHEGMGRQLIVTAEEYDVVYARQWYCYLQRAGATSKIKRGIRRRGRHAARAEIRRGDW